MMEVKDLSPVLVQWIDSMQQAGWGDYDEEVSMACTTIGHLYKANDEFVVIALSRSLHFYGCFITIPRAAVTEIVPLMPTPNKRCPRRNRATGR